MRQGSRGIKVAITAFVAATCLGAVSAFSAETGLHGDLKVAYGEAQKAGKLLLVDFYGGWCPWCVKMDETLADPGVKAALSERFHYVKLDVGRFERHVECLKYYGIDGIPYLIAFDNEGRVKQTADGYQTPVRFKAFLAKVAGAPAAIHPDLTDALKEANRRGKLLLVDFYGGWCPWCVKMDETLADADVKRIVDQGFYYYKLDIGRFERHKECAEQYEVNGIPHIVVFNADGSVLSSKSGYLPVAKFKTFLEGARPHTGMTVLDFADFQDQNDPVLSAIGKAGKSDKRLIVYFHSDGPSHRNVENVLSAMAKEPSAGRFALLRIRLEGNTEVGNRYGCTAAPFVIIFRKDGNVSSFFTDAPSRDAFAAALSKAAQ